MPIVRGTVLEARTASGATIRVRALAAPTRGKNFPLVWVCLEEEYDQMAPDAQYDAIPWPLDAVSVLERT